MSDIKPCVKCGARERYKCGRCVACRRAYQVAYNINNTDRVRAYNRSPRGLAKAARDKQHHPAQRHARNAVRCAIRRGELIRPDICSQCDHTGPIEAHHYAGYERPMVVLFLCRPCHKKADRGELCT